MLKYSVTAVDADVVLLWRTHLSKNSSPCNCATAAPAGCCSLVRLSNQVARSVPIDSPPQCILHTSAQHLSDAKVQPLLAVTDETIRVAFTRSAVDESAATRVIDSLRLDVHIVDTGRFGDKVSVITMLNVRPDDLCECKIQLYL